MPFARAKFSRVKFSPPVRVAKCFNGEHFPIYGIHVFHVVSRSQTVTFAVTIWTTAVERFVLGSPGSRVGGKCERYRKGHESHYIYAWRGVLYATPWAVCNEIHALCGTARTYRPLLPGEPRTKRSTASVTVWLRETIFHAGAHSRAHTCYN